MPADDAVTPASLARAAALDARADYLVARPALAAALPETSCPVCGLRRLTVRLDTESLWCQSCGRSWFLPLGYQETPR